MEITIPYNYQQRDYQLPLLEAIDNGYNRAVLVWHRRSGKDKTLINLINKKAHERKGTYYYFFPTYAQGKKVLWNGMDRDGFRFMDHIPKSIRARTDDKAMYIELLCGSVIQIIGTDNIDSIVGTNPVGCVFSEFSIQNPSAWDYIRPILAENGGFAIFNYTPRGKTHGYYLYKYAKEDPKWFCQLLTVDDTGVFTKEALEQERKEIIARTGSDALFMQEYYCSFEAPIEGAYYGNQLVQAEKDKRIGNVPYDPALKVHTVWDLGVGDATAIWFYQSVGQEIRLIDYYETNGEGLAHYIKYLQSKPYIYGSHFAPHDIEVRELSTGKSRLETALSLGIDFNVVPKLSLEDGIDATRNILAKCWFDESKCEKGLSALRSYHKEYDEKNEIYKSRPHHDWSSHGADAFRYLAISYEREREVYIDSQWTDKQWRIGT